ncbi:MAG TPA: hypothetical protein VL382_11185 [Terriglobales bacterium]|nr:hypothetical protein [Terriglobales bacterium]
MGKDSPGVKQSQPQPAQAGQPDEPAADQELFTTKPLPKSQVTLIGGRVRSVDHIRNRVSVDAFGGGRLKFAFDERTHIYRDGVETTQLAINKGDRIYIDSQLVEAKLFARNIRVVTQLIPADADGQLVAFNPGTGEIMMRDRISSQSIRVRLSKDTKITKQNDQPGTAADLQPGTLVSVQFSPERANRGTVQKVTVLAVPGSSFHFAGRITHLDMKDETLAIDNDSDHKSYDLRFDRAAISGPDELAVGADADITAVFQGSDYVARQIRVTQAAAKNDQNKKDDKKDEASEK